MSGKNYKDILNNDDIQIVEDIDLSVRPSAIRKPEEKT